VADITGTLFAVAMLALYFSSGGMSLIFHTVYNSYTV
jgi:type III secretory pathway component EscT